MLIVLVSFLAASLACAEEVKYLVNPDGSVQIIPVGSRSATIEEAEAIANPGKEIPFGHYETKMRRDGFVYGVKTLEYSKAISFIDGKLLIIDKNIQVEQESEVLVCIMSMLASMALTLIVITQKSVRLLERILSFVACIDVANVFTDAVDVGSVAAAYAAIVAFVLLIVIYPAREIRKGKFFWFMVFLYYVSALAVLFV